MNSTVYNIQFQKGFGLPELQEKFGTEEQCEQQLFRLRWGDQFTCPKCAANAHSSFRRNGKLYYQCSVCRHQESLTAGTILHRTHLPLQIWFMAIYFISEAKTSISSLELHRLLHINHKTAWLLVHKIMQVMTDAENATQLSGRIEMDEAYLGGEIAVKNDHEVEEKQPFIAAVQTTNDPQKKPYYIKLSPVSDLSEAQIAKWAELYLVKGSHVVSEDLSCFAGVEPHCTHEVHVNNHRTEEDQEFHFKWVKTIVSNVKTALIGTFHSLKWQKYSFRYLGAIVYRFNHRFSLDTVFLNLLKISAQSFPKTLKTIRLGL